MKKKAYIALVFATIFWGTTYPTIKYVLSEMHPPPLLFLCLRFMVATAAVSVLLFIRKIRREAASAMLDPNIIILGALNAAAYSLQFEGMKTASAGISAIMVNTYVLFAPLFSRLVTGERITKRKTISVLTGFTGAAVIAVRDLLHSPPEGASFRADTLGTLLLLLCGAVTGLYVAFSDKVMRTEVKTRSPFSVFLASSVYTLLLLLAEIAVTGDLFRFSTVKTESLPWIAYLGLFSTFAAFVLYLYGVQALGAVHTSIFLLGQVVIGIVASVFFLSEPVEIYTVTGALFILGAIWFVGSGKTPRRDRSR
jgi:drug/metabolite transporter (DMT)-like permease